MITIHSKSGDVFSFDEVTEFIAKNGEIYSSTEYEPCYVRNGSSPEIAPTFIGILDKIRNVVITRNGRSNRVVPSDEESII
jgi:hypothetical protein